MYGRINCCLTLRNRWSVFENRVLRRTLGLQSNGVTGEWWKLQASKLHNLHSSLNHVRLVKPRTRRTGYVSYAGQNRNACWVFVGKAEGSRTVGRRNTAGRMWTGLIWLRMGTCVGVLWIQRRNTLLHKMKLFLLAVLLSVFKREVFLIELINIALARWLKSSEILRSDVEYILEKTYSYTVVSVLAMTGIKSIRMGSNC